MENLQTRIRTKQIELDMQLERAVHIGWELQALIDQEDREDSRPLHAPTRKARAPHRPGHAENKSPARPTACRVPGIPNERDHQQK